MGQLQRMPDYWQEVLETSGFHCRYDLRLTKQNTTEIRKRQPKRKRFQETSEKDIKMSTSETLMINTFLVLRDRLMSELVNNRMPTTKINKLLPSTLTEKALSLNFIGRINEINIIANFRDH